ncbi:Cobalamin biosynthesis bifunctional protein CbiET [Fervidicola ferrireducens]|uniref:Cobalamin biosynthesis bifunctional protein CbiET n=1 Tax=Fervidicola ferrireducens TaxID=520764 RepID=A0A140LB22_9FIRM|nr:precorrin-6Y C5,15-methyltransferase (decarboxylating) subunit CbiT [Fervidicola ferrireducens]KXG77747.1 Cobalamin biosynthesis bifunctional protein CbiET [Fervidicola ferrireducens]
MWEYGFGIPDELFVRGNVPMTKEEVRAVSLAKLRLRRDSVLWDVGAGTGSISVEAALFCKEGVVYAVEKDEQALSLIAENARRFGLSNLIPVPGEAPEALFNLPSPDRIFIGGSKGRLRDIISFSCERLKEGDRVVINTVTVESACEALKALESSGFSTEMVLLYVSRAKKVKDMHMLISQNPVCVISGDFKVKGEGE